MGSPPSTSSGTVSGGRGGPGLADLVFEGCDGALQLLDVGGRVLEEARLFGCWLHWVVRVCE